MREERHLLGQMMNQVHQQQQELKELQNQLTTKIDSNSESLKAIQTLQEAIQEAQASQAKVLAESTNKVENNAVTEDKADSKDSKVAGGIHQQTPRRILKQKMQAMALLLK